MATSPSLLATRWHYYHDAPARDVDLRHERLIERQHEGRPAGGRAQLQKIAGAEVVHRQYGTELGAVLGHRDEPDEIGVIELVGGRRRQPLARHEQLDIGQPLGGVTVVDAAQAHDQMPLGRPRCRDHERGRAILALERAILRHRHRIVGEAPELHLAADAVSGADLSDADALRHGRVPGRERQLAAGAALAAAAAAALAFSASSAIALRCLRGMARVGLLRFSRFITPAWSRNRSTRSVGSAPFASQALTLSMSSLRRSVLSLGSSGLK